MLCYMYAVCMYVCIGLFATGLAAFLGGGGRGILPISIYQGMCNQIRPDINLFMYLSYMTWKYTIVKRYTTEGSNLSKVGIAPRS